MRKAHAISSLLRIAVFAIILFAFATLLEASDSSTVNYATNQSITAFSTCKKVANNSGTGLSVYVPTQSSAEWSSFYTNPPVGVSITSCAPPCAGVMVGGYCWYISAAGGNCTSICAAHGGCNLQGTRDYTGSGGTFAQCINVLSALGQNTNVTQYDNYNGWADGCNLYYSNTYPGWYVMRSTSPPTTCEYAYPGSYGYEYRACACNN